MLTTAAFNALLKTLEEPPAHVIFVLCTTDPQKILETILSRCQRFDFHRIGNEDIEHRLAYVCEQEGFDYDDEALAIVARHAKGGMRDALSTLEQLSVFGNGAVHADDARSLLGEVSDQILGEFARAIASRDVAELYGLIRAQVEEGNDLLELTRDLVAHVRDVYVACVAGARAELFEGGAEQAEALAAEAAAFGEHPADRLARVLTVLDDAALEMRGASDVRLVLEIACTRLARPEADLTIEALAERVARLEARVANAAVPVSVAAAQAAPAAVAAASATAQQPTLISGARAAAPAATAPAATSAHQGGMPWDRGAAAAPAAQPAPKPASTQVSKPATPASQPAPASQPVAAPASMPAASPVSTPAPKPNNAAQVAAAGAAETPAVEDAGELQRKWAEVVERVKARQASYAGLLLNARATADDGSKLTVSFPAGSTFAIKMLGRADTQSVVLPTVCAVFGRRTVDYVLDGGGTPAPQHEEHSPSARAAVSADPQPVSSAAPVSSSASAQQQATPVAAPTPSAPKPAAPKPAAPAPAPKPVAPAPKSSDLGKAPWLRSDNPAGAPATGKLPTEPAPRAPERSAAPKAQPAAQSAPWESEQVPYDDAMVGGFAADAAGDDLPPFDVPGAAPAPKPAPASAAPAPSDDAPAAPWESNPGAGSPFGHQGAAPSIPQTEDEAKALIRSVFGQATIFKPVE